MALLIDSAFKLHRQCEVRTTANANYVGLEEKINKNRDKGKYKRNEGEQDRHD